MLRLVGEAPGAVLTVLVPNLRGYELALAAGAVLAAYIALLGGPDPEAQLFYARHLLAASVMAA